MKNRRGNVDLVACEGVTWSWNLSWTHDTGLNNSKASVCECMSVYKRVVAIWTIFVFCFELKLFFRMHWVNWSSKTIAGYGRPTVVVQNENEREPWVRRKQTRSGNKPQQLANGRKGLQPWYRWSAVVLKTDTVDILGTCMEIVK